MRRAAWALAGLMAMGPAASAQQDDLIGTYCVTCHKEKGSPAGGLRLSAFDPARPEENAEIAEKIVTKLRAGAMPPPAARRPEAAAVRTLITQLESRLDAGALRGPRPGWRPFQRLNRAEYGRAVSDLLGLDVDVASYLPPDTISAGFDNIADVQAFSPTLITGYLRAASQISRRALADPASRRRVFTCRGRTTAQEDACAGTIVTALATSAYRGAATGDDVADALRFYRDGRTAGFENGVRLALQSILASPRFLFRLEPAPPGAAAMAHAVAPQALAVRLASFLWASGPDATLLEAARSGALATDRGLEAQVRRMLADPRSGALANRFATQWLRLQDLDRFVPDRRVYPAFDRRLTESMRGETTRFVDSIVREDRSVLDLLTADYTFVDERLAAHYGLAGVKGSAFRRVRVPDERRGLLGQAAILASTSVADRSSPVLRGKWVLDVLLGTPPPPPPPNVPALDDSVKATRGEVHLSTRQRIEEHRRNPSCNACHRFIDPLGLTLENFDATGAWRTLDNGVAVDAVGDLYDGTRMDGPAGLRKALLAHQDLVLRSFTLNLMTYATGRRLDYRDMPAVRAIVTAAGASQNRWSAFVLGVVRSDAFRMSQPPGETQS